MNVMEIQDIVFYAIITVFSLVLVIISFLSYWKYQKPKLLLIGVVFLLFLTRGILLSIGLFIPLIQEFTSSIYIWVFDIAMLTVLYITSLRK